MRDVKASIAKRNCSTRPNVFIRSSVSQWNLCFSSFWLSFSIKLTDDCCALSDGTAIATKSINIENDGEIDCDEQVALLTGDCSAEGKCWVFSTIAGAITVGPTPGSGEWFSSTESGLVDAQYDDSSCFFIEGLVYEYRNNGQTVNPWEGFEAQDFTPLANQAWSFNGTGGLDGLGQISLPTGSFMGVRDSGPVYDIVSLTETELVVRSPFLNADGTTPDEGWFELYFVAE